MIALEKFGDTSSIPFVLFLSQAVYIIHHTSWHLDPPRSGLLF